MHLGHEVLCLPHCKKREITNILKEIVQNKSCPYLCSQDVQEYKGLMNCLPTVGLKLAEVEVFTPQKLANATSQGYFPYRIESGLCQDPNSIPQPLEAGYLPLSHTLCH